MFLRLRLVLKQRCASARDEQGTRCAWRVRYEVYVQSIQQVMARQVPVCHPSLKGRWLWQRHLEHLEWHCLPLAAWCLQLQQRLPLCVQQLLRHGRGVCGVAARLCPTAAEQ